MVTANATTSGAGSLLFENNTTGLYRTGGLSENKKDPWRVRITDTSEAKLVELISDNDYNLIVRHVLAEGYSPSDNCRYGKSGMVREIVVLGRTYRSNSYTIFTRKNEI